MGVLFLNMSNVLHLGSHRSVLPGVRLEMGLEVRFAALRPKAGGCASCLALPLGPCAMAF